MATLTVVVVGLLSNHEIALLWIVDRCGKATRTSHHVLFIAHPHHVLVIITHHILVIATHHILIVIAHHVHHVLVITTHHLIWEQNIQV